MCYYIKSIALSHNQGAFVENKPLPRTVRAIIAHLDEAGVGSISEIFDGDAPNTPRGCFAQAWSVSEVLRLWRLSA